MNADGFGLAAVSKYLDAGFAPALRETPLYARHDWKAGMNVELFIVGLYLVFGARVARFFERGSLQRMSQGICPGIRQMSYNESRERLSQLPSGTGMASVVDRRLLAILSTAATLSKAALHEKITLEAFIGALALDQEAQETLSSNWGVRLRGAGGS